MSDGRRPPRLAATLLALLLPPAIRDAVLGDLEERWRRVRRQGAGRAWRWYWKETLSMPVVSLRRRAAGLDRGRGRTCRIATEGGGDGMGIHWGDLRVAGRSLLRRRAFTGVALTTLLLSVGAATLAFSVLEGVLLRSLPYAAPGRLVRIHATDAEWRESENEMLRDSWDRVTFSLEILDRFRETPAPLTSVGATRNDFLTLEAGGRTSRHFSARVTEGLFATLGVEAALGRLPSPGELRSGGRVLVLSHAVWTGRFGADPAVVGRGVTVDGEPWTVIGVMPASFLYPTEATELWGPMAETTLREHRRSALLTGVGRLAPGAEAADAVAALGDAMVAVVAENPDYGRLGVAVASLEDELLGDVRGGLRLLFGAALVVVLLACVNLANLMVARVARRRGELAVRAALGAGRAGLVWIVTTEAVLLCLVGSGLGIALATGLLEPFVQALETGLQRLPRADGIGVNGPVLAFAGGLTLMVTLLAGLPGALAASRRPPSPALGYGRRTGPGPGTRHLQRLLLAVETTLAVALLAGAALLVRSAWRLSTVDLGYRAEGLVFADLRPDADAYPSSSLPALYDGIVDRVAGLPRVRSAALADDAPTSGTAFLTQVADARSPEPGGDVMKSAAGPGYFETLGLEVVRGRGFAPREGPGSARVAVLSESLAARLFGAGDPLGQVVRVGMDDAVEATVVGVVRDARMMTADRPPGPQVWVALEQDPVRGRTLVLRAAGDARELLAPVRQLLAELEGVEVRAMGLVTDEVHQDAAPTRLRGVLMASLAGIAALLALVGIAGVAAQLVSEQLRDIGVRMALGAAPSRETGRVLLQILPGALFGVVAGTGGALLVSRVLDEFVFEITTRDPAAYAAAVVLLVGLASVAAWLPARRAARVDPVEVLDEA